MARQFQIYNIAGLGDKPRPTLTRMPPPRRPKFTGLFHDDVATDSYWIREKGVLHLPALDRAVKTIAILGEVLAAPEGDVCRTR